MNANLAQWSLILLCFSMAGDGTLLALWWLKRP
jgi:hypothetical protein